jgi:hypothetical protein
MAKKHLVYILESSCGKFYVGRTCNFKMRMYTHKYSASKKTKLGRAIRKYGWSTFEVSVLEDDLTFEEVKEREKFFISLIDSVKYGYNILRGGAGYEFGMRDIKTARKIRALNITTGEMTVFDSITDASEELDIHSGKICAILNKKVEKSRQGNPMTRTQAKGYTFEDYVEDAPDMTYKPPPPLVMSEDAKAKIGAAAKGRGAKGVIGTHVLGYTVQFDVIKDAARELGIDDGEITKNAKGKRGPVGGFSWEYASEKERDKYPVWDVTRRKGAKGRPVYRIMEDGSREEYPSTEQAARVLGCDRSNIDKAIKRNGKAYGYRWYFCKIKNIL